MKKMVYFLRRFFLIIGILICFECSQVIAPEEAHAGFNSLIERESQVNYSGFIDFIVKLIEDMYICFYKDVIFNLGQLNETCIPRIITSDSSYENDCASSGDNQKAVAYSVLGLFVFIAALIVVVLTAWIPIFGQAIFLVAVTVLAAVIVACLGTYALAPHEYINGLLGRMKCEKRGSQVINTAPNALTMTDVPFFYNCAAQPTDKTKLALDVQQGDLSGLDAQDGYGNMNDPSMPYCQGDNINYALNNLQGQYAGINSSDIQVGSIIVGTTGKTLIGQITALFSSRTLCDVSNDSLYHFSMNQVRKGGWGKNTSTLSPLPYYRIHSGKIQLCAANISIFLGALISGCTYVAPPIETIPISAGFTDETRCSYFLSSRTDLHSLGININSGVTNGNYSSVGLFLQSDFHIMSTIVGCVQDLLVKIVVGGTSDSQEPFLSSIQENLKGIVLVILVLYISLLGIKIMSNPNPPQTSEVVMYILKFAAVFVISGVGGHSIWYNTDSTKPGLYSMLLDGMNDLAGRVLESTNDIAPVNMCYYQYGDGNLLAERNIPAQSGLVPTVSLMNQNTIKLSVWDFVDCKLASYLSLNSCKYTMSGMISMWLVSMCIFLPSIFLLGVTTVIFSIVLFITMLRFVHLSIVSMFALTILVLVSPIMSCFILFDYTKETFKSWFKMLLGYILYPAMIFSFIALMTTTFDSIFYGQPINVGCLQTHNCSMSDICGTSKSDNSSIYCTIIRAVSTERTTTPVTTSMCNVSSGTILNALTQNYEIKLLGMTIFNVTALKDILFDDVFIGIAKMMLFVILFYNMTNSIISFFETLLQVYGIGNLVPSYGTVGSKMFSAAAKAPLAAVTAPMAAAKLAKNFYDNTRK